MTIITDDVLVILSSSYKMWLSSSESSIVAGSVLNELRVSLAAVAGKLVYGDLRGFQATIAARYSDLPREVFIGLVKPVQLACKNIRFHELAYLVSSCSFIHTFSLI